MPDDFLLFARCIVPIEPAGALERHALAVRAGRIAALLPAADAAARFPDLQPVELPHHIVMPGLVSAHTQAGATLLRGLSGERRERAGRSLVSPQFVFDGTLLACAEMLAGGITCFGNAYFFPESSLEAARSMGVRSAQGLLVKEAASSYASDPADYLRKGLALRDLARDDELASFCIAPRGAALSDASLRQAASLAAELDLPLHVDLAEIAVDRLYKLGLLDPNLVAVSGVGLSAIEIELLARHGCWIVPRGAARGLEKPELNFALGAHGARLDLFEALRSSGLAPQRALRAATLGGASALGVQAHIGSLEPGKFADLVALDASQPGFAPCPDPVFAAAGAAGRDHVSHVWVAGRQLVSEGKLQNSPFSHLDTRWDLWQNAVARAGS